MAEREQARVRRGETVRYDVASGMATWETSQGDVVGRWFGEVVARYVVRDRILRWSWAGRSSISTLMHAEVIAREGQSRGVPQLAMSVVGDLDMEDAATLVRLGVLMARGQGVLVEPDREAPGARDTAGHRNFDDAEEIVFVGLFDSLQPRDDASEPSRYSVPPPVVRSSKSSRTARREGASSRFEPPRTSGAREVSSSSRPSPEDSDGAVPSSRRGDRSSVAPRSGARPSTSPRSGARVPSPPVSGARLSSPPASYRTFPPIRETYGPRSARRGSAAPPSSEGKVREPARSLFLPVATAVLGNLAEASPGFKQALFVVTVDHDAAAGGDKPRLFLSLAVVDASGFLHAADPSAETVDAAARMVEADRIDGNGRWRKLSVRVTPKADGGATLHVDVV